jgi:hypothetical protein
MGSAWGSHHWSRGIKIESEGGGYTMRSSAIRPLKQAMLAGLHGELYDVTEEQLAKGSI